MCCVYLFSGDFYIFLSFPISCFISTSVLSFPCGLFVLNLLYNVLQLEGNIHYTEHLDEKNEIKKWDGDSDADILEGKADLLSSYHSPVKSSTLTEFINCTQDSGNVGEFSELNSTKPVSVNNHKNTGEHRYPCGICNKSFMASFILKRHLGSHAGERFKCDFCDQLFTSKA